jgi:hypothetical protein
MEIVTTDPVKFHIHYDVDNHFIPMSDFLTASHSAQKIIDDLNRQILGGQLRYKLVVIPPTEGTFLKTVGIVAVTLVANAMVVPVASDYVLGAFEGIAEHKPSDYGKDHGRALRDLTVGFFSKEVEELEKCVPHELNLDRAFKSKTDFYRSCQANDDIKGLGFDNTRNFPIRHGDFKHHMSKDRTRPLDSDFVLYDAILTSPVTEDKNFQWDFEDTVTGQKISAHMRDEAFKKGVLSGKYPIKQSKKSDVLKILVEYKKQEVNGEIKNKETCVETVYSFNDKTITPIPTNLPKGTRFNIKGEAPMEKIWKASNE